MHGIKMRRMLAFDAYFDITSDDFVFLGTAPEERMERKDFMAFLQALFDKKSTWDFKPSDRQMELFQKMAIRHGLMSP